MSGTLIHERHNYALYQMDEPYTHGRDEILCNYEIRNITSGNVEGRAMSLFEAGSYMIQMADGGKAFLETAKAEKSAKDTGLYIPDAAEVVKLNTKKDK